jgi:uncharacterized membrane protein
MRKPKDVVIERIGGYLHKIVPVLDKAGNVVHHVAIPFPAEFKFRDFFQIVVGACILMVPVAFTEEVWMLSQELPLKNIIMIAFMSISIISTFVYYNFYRFTLKEHFGEYLKRVVATYLVSITVVGIFLTLINRCPWHSDVLLALKRIILVALPASMSGTLSDLIK